MFLWQPCLCCLMVQCYTMYVDSILKCIARSLLFHTFISFLEWNTLELKSSWHSGRSCEFCCCSWSLVALLDTVLGEVHALNECLVPYLFSPQDNLKKKDRLEDQFLWCWLVAILSAPQWTFDRSHFFSGEAPRPGWRSWEKTCTTLPGPQ